ncbi:MAG: elongation factor G, partial [Planctomycetales bacterium]
GKQFYLMDTPGYPDFIGQTISALHGVDTAAIVINAHSGIEVNTRRVFQEAGDLGLGRMIVINKLATATIDFPALVADLQEFFGPACQLLNVPIGHGADFKGVVGTLKPPEDAEGALIDPNEVSESLLESIIENDEEVMERYFEGQPPTDEELERLIIEAISQGSLIPMVCVAGKSGLGVPELLDAFVQCSLPPGKVRRVALDSEGNEQELKPDPDGPLVAHAFKTRIDPFVQRLSFLRIYSGSLSKDSNVQIVGERKSVKVSQLLQVQADKTDPVDKAIPGQVVAIAKNEDLSTGRTIGEHALPAMKFPTPMVGLAVTPKSRGDEAKLSTALHKIVEEDPTFHLERDAQTKELVATGMSELHLKIIQERLHRRDKVDIETKEPKTPYRETIQADSENSYRHKKQSGGRGQFGEVHIRMFPLPRDTDIEEYATKARFASLKSYHYDEVNNFLWVDSVVGGTIPSHFMPAVEKGFKERIAKGVIAGYQIQNVCVEVHFGKHHPVDSSEAAFKMAASKAFSGAFEKAKPCLLEPIVQLHVTVPNDNVGDINSDLSTRRGRPLGLDPAGGNFQTVHAEVPLAKVKTYARDLARVTGGQGSYSVDYSHYDVVPPNEQKEIIDKATLHEDEED